MKADKAKKPEASVSGKPKPAKKVASHIDDSVRSSEHNPAGTKADHVAGRSGLAAGRSGQAGGRSGSTGR